MRSEAPTQDSQRGVVAASPYGLDLLEFRLPEFARVSWTGDAARELWEPRLQRIIQVGSETEPLAVLDGLRRCSVTTVRAEDLPEFSLEYAGFGLSTLPMSLHGLSGYCYDDGEVSPALGEPLVYRVVVGAPEHVSDFQSAWFGADQEAIGSLLGYPRCCREFFHEVWVDEGLSDTTWPMAVRSVRHSDGRGNLLEVAGPPECNILWRWMGVRAVSHLPCSFECKATLELAQRLLELMRSHGHGQEVDWLLEILEWPVEWSCLHGIAEIKTPVLKVSASTDATASKYVVRRRGTGFPEGGARGLSWAFRSPLVPLMTGSKRFAAGLANSIERDPEEG